MKKEFTISKYIKKVFIFIGVILVGLSLASCDSSNRKSTSGLNLEEVYATSGNYKVTNGELYEEFRYSGSSYLEERFNNALYAAEIEEIKNDLAKDDSTYKQDITDMILEDIYGTSDEKELAKEEADHLNHHETEYVDSMCQKGYEITKEQIAARNFTSVYANYYLSLAKKLGAKKVLAKELGSETEAVDYDKLIENLTKEDADITENDVITYYKNNYVNKGVVDAVLVRFNSSSEASDVLKKFGLVAHDGHFYLAELPADTTDSVYTSSSAFEKYIANKTMTSSDTDLEGQGAGYATTLRIYAEIYNYVYTFRDPIVFSETTTFEAFVNNFKQQNGEDKYKEQKHLMYYYFVKSLVDADATYRLEHTDAETAEFNAEAEQARFDEVAATIKAYNEKASNKNYTVLDNERLNGYNSSLATYVYETLSTKATEETLEKRYIVSARSYGSYYFLVFKIAQEEAKELYTETKDEDGKVTYNFDDHKDFLKEVLAELVDEKLTDDYITEKYDERAKEANVYIYDSVMELEYMQTSSTLASNYKKTSKKDKENVAMIKYNDQETKLSSVDFFNYMEKTTGSSLALSLLFNKFVKDSEEYKKLEDNYKDYENSLKLMLNYFSNGYYSSYGYSADLGKYNFLRLLYHNTNIDDVIRNNMMLSTARSAILTDVTKLFTTTEFLKTLAEYSTTDFEEYFNVTATQINIYTDIDEDGEADELSDALTEKAQELLTLVIEKIAKSSDSYTTALSSIISEFNSTSRYTADATPTDTKTVWASYRKLGLYIDTTSLSSVTNTSSYSEPLKEILAQYYNDETVMSQENGFISSVIVKESFKADNKFSSLILTSAVARTSAKYDDEEQIAKLYAKVPTLYQDKLVVVDGIDYSTDLASSKAMEAYLYDYLLLGDVNSLPGTTTSHLDAYFLPYLERYTSSANQAVIMNRLLGSVTFTKAESKTQFDNYLRMTKDSYDDYDFEHDSWWNFMEGKEAK